MNERPSPLVQQPGSFKSGEREVPTFQHRFLLSFGARVSLNQRCFPRRSAQQLFQSMRAEGSNSDMCFVLVPVSLNQLSSSCRLAKQLFELRDIKRCVFKIWRPRVDKRAPLSLWFNSSSKTATLVKFPRMYVSAYHPVSVAVANIPQLKSKESTL